MLILTAFPLDNSITNLYTISILQQGGGEYGRKERAQDRTFRELDNKAL